MYTNDNRFVTTLGFPLFLTGARKTESTTAVDEQSPPPNQLKTPDAPLDEASAQEMSKSGSAGGVSTTELRSNSASPMQMVANVVSPLFRLLLGTSEEGKLEERTNELENKAFEVLEVLVPKQVGKAEAAFDTWFSKVEARAAKGERLDALEHLTLVHVLKEKLFEKHEALQPYIPRMREVVQQSHHKITGRQLNAEAALKARLPKRYLRKQSRDARKIHAAVHASKGDGFFATMSDFAKDYIPKKKDALFGVALLGMMFSGTGQELVAGAVHGYLLATIMEHVIHKYAGHANKQDLERIGELLERFGPMGKAIHKELEIIAFSHGTIHHGTYAGSYVDRFAPRNADLPPGEIEAYRTKRKAAIDKMAHARGADEAEGIFKSDYGRKLADSLRNALRTVPVAAVLTLITGALGKTVGLDPGLLFFTTSVLSSLLFIPASNYVHPYLHMTKEEAMEKAGPVMRELLKTNYVSHIAQAHYLHHREDVQNNQNLVPGADFALGYTPTQVEAIVALRKMGTFY